MGQKGSKKDRGGQEEKKGHNKKDSQSLNSAPSGNSSHHKQKDSQTLAVVNDARLRSSTNLIRDMEPNAEVGAQLARVPILCSLNTDERNKLGGALEEVEYTPGQTVFKQGEDGDTFFIIKSGTCMVSINGNVVCELSDGDYFGEQSILKGVKRSATIIASTNTTESLRLWRLTKAKFQALFKDDRININFLERNQYVYFEKSRGAVTAATPDQKEEVLRRVDMPTSVRDLVLNAVNNSLLFQQLDGTQRKMVVSVMDAIQVKKGTVVIREGEEGDTFFVVESGSFDVFQYDKDTRADKKVDQKKTGDSFGELALMYNAPRNATVVASSDSILRVLQQAVFSRLVREAREKQLKLFSEWLKEVELLQPLSNFERMSLVEAIELVDVEAGTTLFLQGDAGDAMYVVVEGTVQFSVKDENGLYKNIEGPHGTCLPGGYFGERALMNNAPRAAAATCGVFCRLLKIDRVAFEVILGPLEGIMKKKELAYTDKQEARSTVWVPADVDFATLVTKQVLGRGSYGFVTLVEDPKTQILYALKAVSKSRVVETNQKSHIFNEKNLMCRLDHPFLIKLHATHKDQDMLYFLMEPCRGGELFRILRRCRAFPVPQAQFYAACVILGFEYLHKQDLIYRDLKPENLLLDEAGYLKITDFGFLKEVVGKTWTMCGTPEYMAPEIIKQKGHGRAVDWWCVGIFIYEMLVSSTPFYRPEGDQMEMYRRILLGKVRYPNHLSMEAKELITGLLQLSTSKRLGCGKEGATGIKNAPWFAGFDWEALLWRKLPAPLVPAAKAVEKLQNFATHAEPAKVKPYVDDGTDWDRDF